MTITKEMTLIDVLGTDEQIPEFLFEVGMHCLGCPGSAGKSLEEACAKHGVDCDALVEKINAYLTTK